MIRQTITSVNDVMTFGKHKGKDVQRLIDRNPAYLLWLNEEGIVKFSQDVLEKAAISDANQSPPEDWYWTPD